MQIDKTDQALISMLRQNARATEKNWKNLYGELLVKYNQGKNSPYDEAHRPKNDRLTHY